MKTIKLIIILSILVLAASCKKDNSKIIIGKWAEQPPCVDSGSCFAFELKSDYTYAQSSPFTSGTGTYAIKNNSSISFTGPIGNGTYDFQINNNGKELVLKRFYTGFYVDTPLFHKDVVLLKMN